MRWRIKTLSDWLDMPASRNVWRFAWWPYRDRKTNTVYWLEWIHVIQYSSLSERYYMSGTYYMNWYTGGLVEEKVEDQ